MSSISIAEEKKQLQDYLNNSLQPDSYWERARKSSDYETYGKDFMRLVFVRGKDGCLAKDQKQIQFYSERDFDLDMRAKVIAGGLQQEQAWIKERSLNIADITHLGLIAKCIQNQDIKFYLVSDAITDLAKRSWIRILLWEDYKESRPFKKGMLPKALTEFTYPEIVMYHWICLFCRDNGITWPLRPIQALADRNIIANEFFVALATAGLIKLVDNLQRMP